LTLSLLQINGLFNYALSKYVNKSNHFMAGDASKYEYIYR
jgi:hypothetical protein